MILNWLPFYMLHMHAMKQAVNKHDLFVTVDFKDV